MGALLVQTVGDCWELYALRHDFTVQRYFLTVSHICTAKRERWQQNFRRFVSYQLFDAGPWP